MANLYSSNFDGETTGALPSGWVNKTGTWTVQALRPVSGAKAFGSSSTVDGDAVLYTGIAAAADMGVRTDSVMFNITAGGASGRIPFVSHILRSDTAWANGYLIVLQDAGASSTQLHFEVYKKVGGAISVVGISGDVLTGSPPADGDVYHMRSKVVGNQISVYLWKNADAEPTTATYIPPPDSNVSAAGYAGLYNSLLGTALVPTADNFTIDDSVASVATGFGLTGATAVDGFIFQRVGTTATVNFTGTYTGSPTAIQARIVDLGGTALAGFDWTTKVASPAGGVFAFSFAAVPQGGFYKVQLRDSATPGDVTSPTNSFGVGVRIALIGQSNIETLSMYLTGTPNAKLRVYDRWRSPGTWNTSTTGNGSIALGNALVTALGGSIPVALIQYAVSGAGLHIGCGLATPTSGNIARDWLTLTATSGNPWHDFTTAMNLIGASAELVVYGQGESDAMVNTFTASYGADLATLFGRIRTSLGAGIKIILPMLGQTNVAATSAAAWDTVRQAQIAAAAADGNTFLVSKQDLQCDAASPDMTPADLLTWGTRLGQKIAYTMGLVAYGDGPRIANVTAISSTVYEITLTHQGGNDITPSSATQIVDLRVKDGASIVTPTTITRFAANKIRFTLGTAPAGTVTVQSSYDKLPATQVGIVRDNTTLALPLESSAPITANVSTVSGVVVSPSAPTVAGGATQAFTVVVNGTGGPSQAVTWSTSAGSISVGGLLTAPASTGSIQTVTVTATSVQDGTKAGTATVTVPAVILPATSVTLTLTSRAGAIRASLTGLKWAFFDQMPGSQLAPVAQGTVESTNGSGVIVLSITGTTLLPGATGWFTVTNSNGTVNTSDFTFAGPVVVA